MFRKLRNLFGSWKKRNFDLASVRKRLKYWSTLSTAPTASQHTKSTIRARARSLARNNPNGFTFKNLVSSLIVSKGFKPKCDSEKVIKDWEYWSNDPDLCDFDEHSNFLGLTSLVMEAVAESGACLVRKRFVRDLEIPLQLQVLEIDFLDSSQDGETETEIIKQGIVFSKKTEKRIAYILYKVHPQDEDESDVESVRVPAKDILHIFRKDRPGAYDGVSWYTPFAMLLKELTDYREAQIIKQKISACHVGMIYDSEAPDLDNFTEEENTFDIDGRLEPGAFNYLPPGKDIRFNNPPKIDGFDEFDYSTMKAVAAGTIFSYESMSGDYSRVNFTSGRMGNLVQNSNIEHIRDTLVEPQFLTRVFKWFREALFLIGRCSEEELRQKVSWTNPKAPFVNPVQDINALATEVEKGFKTQSEALRERGFDPDEFVKEKKREKKLMEVLKDATKGKQNS